MAGKFWQSGHLVSIPPARFFSRSPYSGKELLPRSLPQVLQIKESRHDIQNQPDTEARWTRVGQIGTGSDFGQDRDSPKEWNSHCKVSAGSLRKSQKACTLEQSEPGWDVKVVSFQPFG